jgi:hypothetical protein
LIIIFSINPVINQSAQPENSFYGRYRVNLGDSMKYRFVKILSGNESYFTNQIQLNGQKMDINITEDSTILITIKDKNITSNGESIWIQEEYSIPGQPRIISDIKLNNNIFIKKSFENKDELNSYINSKDSSLDFLIFSSIDGRYINNYYNFSNSPNVVYYANESYNWQSGWLEYYEDEIFLDTKYENIRIERITELLPVIIEFTLNGLIIGLLGIGLGSIMILWSNFKKESKLSLNGDKNTFMYLLRTKILKKRKSNSTDQIENLLNLLEEIIQEGNNEI